jgi:glycosyltransferase involved in cell wall biosynthesis
MSNLRTIAIDLVPLLPGGQNGGAKIFVIELIRCLSKLSPQTHFVLLTRSSSHGELAPLEAANVSRQLIWDDASEGAHSINLPDLVWDRGGQSSLRTLAMKMLSPKASANVINTSLFFCPFAGSVFSEVQVPTVSTVYDLQYRAYPQFFSTNELLERDYNFRFCCKMSAMAVISNNVRSSVLKEELIDANSVFTIYIRLPHRLPNVDLESKNKTLQGLALSNRCYLLYPANFWPHKNHEMLLTAFSMARSNGLPSDVKLLCTGAPGERMREIKHAAEALGLGEVAVFPGFLSENEFASVIGSCLGVIFPSLYEGFGMPVLEAMSAGCPVACSNRTSLPEIAGDAAILFDPRNPMDIMQAMLRMANDETYRADLIKKGIAQAELFSDPAQMAREYLQLFAYAFDKYLSSQKQN